MIDITRVPSVPWDPNNLDLFVDLYTYLLGKRIIVLSDDITRKSASVVISQMLYLESIDNKNDIKIYINSAGGSMSSTFAIYDAMVYIKSPIRTVCMGECFSGASLILSAGTKGRRSATTNSIIMMHEPQIIFGGPLSDSERYHEYALESRERLVKLYEKCTNRTYEQIKKDLERDVYIYPEKAVEYGLIDEILGG